MSAGDPARRAVLERLVADCELDQSFLNRPAAERFAHLVGDAADIGLTGTLGDRYRIERELGRGGMARVYDRVNRGAGFGVYDPMYDPIRRSKRFQALLRLMNNP